MARVSQARGEGQQSQAQSGAHRATHIPSYTDLEGKTKAEALHMDTILWWPHTQTQSERHQGGGPETLEMWPHMLLVPSQSRTPHTVTTPGAQAEGTLSGSQRSP